MGKIEVLDLVSLSGRPVKCISVRLKPEQDLHDIEPIAKSIAREKLQMGRVDVLDYMWSDKAQAWAVFVQKRSDNKLGGKVNEPKAATRLSVIEANVATVRFFHGGFSLQI
jgi:hypothetical protein